MQGQRKENGSKNQSKGKDDHKKSDRQQKNEVKKDWLNRETPYMCHISFKNDLPEIPCDPKLLIPKYSNEQLSKHFLTTIEQNSQRDLHFIPQEAIPVNIMDHERFTVYEPGKKFQLHPQDQELLEDVTSKKFGYQSALQNKQDQQKRQSEQQKLEQLLDQGHQLLQEDYNQLSDRDKILKDIETSFELTKKKPVHQTNSQVQPVKILPVYPDFDLWKQNFLNIRFDTHPIEDHDKFQHLSLKEKRYIADNAILKSYVLNLNPNQDQHKAQQQDEQKIKFVAYLSQKPDEAREALSKKQYNKMQQETLPDYHWLREYSYNIKQNKESQGERLTYMFIMKPNQQAATYVDLNSSLICTKQRETSELAKQNVEKPGKILIHKRQLNEAEIAEQHKKIQILNNGIDMDDVQVQKVY